MEIVMGGTSGVEITFPPVQLFNEAGETNMSNINTYVAHTGKTLNINEKDLKESLQWSLQRGNRTGRAAYQFIIQLAATKDLKIKF